MAVRYQEIAGWPGYRVGDDGSAWSCHDIAGRITDEWHRLGGHTTKSGFVRITLPDPRPDKKGRQTAKPLSHLILESFVGPRPIGMMARYRDDDRKNNALANVYWGKPPKRDNNPRRGEEHSFWKGDAASVASKRKRAQKRFRLGPCERCGKPATDRHHKDANVGNNTPGNIAILCRRCHMTIDGRLERFIDELRRTRPINPPSPCVNCELPYKPLRRGRCCACDAHFRRTGKERKRPALADN